MSKDHVPPTKVEREKKLSTVQTYAIRSARDTANRMADEFQSMINAVAKEVGIDTEGDERWALNKDCTSLLYKGLEPKTEEPEDES